jgi:protoporphyrinogen oxidase
MSLGQKVVIIGAGPAGLSAAHSLAKQGLDVTVVESNPDYVGGIARTEVQNGFRFDIGGHRFFSKSQRVLDFWKELLGETDFLVRSRVSRIYYRGKFFAYPLQPVEALLKLGLFESVLCVLSYLKSKFSPIPDPKSFEDWIVNAFGRRLFATFFRTYTEKVWGMKCHEISKDWASQRVNNLHLGSAILQAITPRWLRRDRSAIKSLIESFHYPRKGPGMMWEACADHVRNMNGKIIMGYKVQSLKRSQAGGRWRISCVSTAGAAQVLEADHVISTAPIRELVKSIEPALPAAVINSAERLKYRDFLTVVLMLKCPDRFHDNWIYIHDTRVRVARVQNFKAWSPEMVPGLDYNCLGLEYFCAEGDDLWAQSDSGLADLAKREVGIIGLANPADVIDCRVIRQAKAYPVYDESYTEMVRLVRSELETSCAGLHLVGRNGMHKYNNQDHSMLTAMLVAENIIAGRKLHDPWLVNQDAEYIEADVSQKAPGSTGLRSVPRKRAA